MLPSYIRPSRDTLLGVARAAEHLGFDSVWTNSHTVVPASFKPRYPYSEDGIPSWNAGTAWADAMTTLGFVAAATERVRLGVAVVPLIITDPITLAKQAATVDLLSNGRFELGVGAIRIAAERGAGLFIWLQPPERVAEYGRKLRALRAGAPLAACVWTSQEERLWGGQVRAMEQAGVDLMVIGRRYDDRQVSELERFAAEFL